MLVRLVGGVAATRRAAATRRSDASCRASLTPQTHESKSRSDKPRLLRLLYFFDASPCRSDSSDFGREKSRPRRSTPPTERVTGRVACCGARHPTGALMSLSDTIYQELARAHHENLTALKERSWLNPNLSHTAVRPGSGTAWPMLGLRPCFLSCETQRSGSQVCTCRRAALWGGAARSCGPMISALTMGTVAPP